MLDELNTIVAQAAASIIAIERLSDLEQLRSTLLGKKSPINHYLKKIYQLPSSDRPQFGQAINEAKQTIEGFFKTHYELLQTQELNLLLSKETIDITLKGCGVAIGSLHPITQTRERIETFFKQIGFSVSEGPEVEDEYHNFEALNISSNHPARALHDTFYFANGSLLRTHTSPVQIRAMKQRRPPIKMLSAGKVYRCDSDMTHTPMFHQLEGLLIDETANFSELKGLLTHFLQHFFEKKDLCIRFRASYFPFTEPSAEVDIRCVLCEGSGCRVCSQTGWLEILGCGMVHPAVLEEVALSSDHYQGYAFGLGIDRLALLRYQIPDLRFLFKNDLRFLKQF